MAFKTKEIIGKQLLDLGTVKIASNKPENVFLLILNTEDKFVNISVLYDRRHNYLDVSKDFRGPRHKVDMEHDERHIEITDEQRRQIIEFIESYE